MNFIHLEVDYVGEAFQVFFELYENISSVWFELRRSIELDVSVTWELLFNCLFILVLFNFRAPGERRCCRKLIRRRLGIDRAVRNC